jgi:hypothetical protein
VCADVGVEIGRINRTSIASTDQYSLLVALLVLDLADNHTLGHRLDDGPPADTRNVDVDETDVLDTACEVAGDATCFSTVLVADGCTGCCASGG